ncbi:MAG: DUF5668 domain-containing protein [Acidobacteriota bacterium]
MKCFYHYDKDSTATCYICSHPLCEACLIEFDERSYCKECVRKTIDQFLQKGAGERQPTTKPQQPGKSPAIATLLSLIPGLGFIYLGLYMKGMAIFAAWVGFLVLFENGNDIGPLIGIAFWAFQLVYTNQEAKRLNRSMMGEQGKRAEKEEIQGSLAWGIIIVIIGFLFLIHNFGFNLSWLVKFWPLLVIGIGIQMIWSFVSVGRQG